MYSKKSKLKKLTETNKAYIAGIMDGEGHFYIRVPYEGTTYGSIRLRITEGKIVEFIKKMTGIGTIYSYIPNQRRKDGLEKRKVFEWSVQTREDVFNITKQIEPYLIIKKRQAQLLMELENLKNQGIHDGKDIDILRAEMKKYVCKGNKK